MLCIVHRVRSATQDVDAVFEPKSLIRELAASVGRDFNLPEDWLNDGVPPKTLYALEEILEDFN